MKIDINRDDCIECGTCATTCADVFELPSGQKAAVVSKYRKGDPGKGEVPDNLNKCAQLAADACPVEVIKVTK